MTPALLRARLEAALGARFPASLGLGERPAPDLVSTGIAEIDALTAGLPRGALTEICGPVSSGRTSLLLSALAEATRREEACALVDADDAFDPHSAAAGGVELERLLWVRCGNRVIGPSGHRVISEAQITRSPDHPITQSLEQALRATDLLLQAGGFGLVALDLGGVPPALTRRVPLTSWFRFRRAVERTPTVLLLVEQEPCAKTCASLVLRLQPSAVSFQPSAKHSEEDSSPTHGCLLSSHSIRVEVLRSRIAQNKLPTTRADFQTPAVWA